MAQKSNTKPTSEKEINVELLKQLENDVKALEEFRDGYVSLKISNNNLEKKVKALEYLASSHESNLRNVARQRILAEQKSIRLKSNLNEAQEACEFLHLSPEEVAAVVPERYQEKTARLKETLLQTLQKEEERARKLTELKKQASDLQRKVLEYKQPQLAQCCRRKKNSWHWNKEMCQFPGITRMHDFLVDSWAQGPVYETVSQSEVDEMMRKDLERGASRGLYQASMKLPPLGWND